MMNSKNKIIELLGQRHSLSVNLLVDELGVSRQVIHRTLNNLQDENLVVKTGRPPKVFYSLVDKPTPRSVRPVKIKETIKSVIDNEFLYITPLGSRLVGWQGFVYWCNERQMNIESTADTYLETLGKYSRYKNDGLIDGLQKMKSSFGDVYLDSVFYLDFYSIEIFGKTKLGQLLLFAKQSQDRSLINEIADKIKPEIEKLIKDHRVSAVGFIPPTVKRELQLMKQLQKRLNLSVKTIDLVKIKTAVAIPQKTLSKIDDRIINAKNTIAVNEIGRYDNILLIDDAIGSGATLNEVAKKIRDKNMSQGSLIGLAIVGSFKGFEVISEV